MDLTEDGWLLLQGAYGRPYDPRPALRRLIQGDDAAWSELWEELYHQGGIGNASYAAVPLIVRSRSQRQSPDWNAYAFVASIEEVRLSGKAPPMPSWIEKPYQQAWKQLEHEAIDDLRAASEDNLVSSILAVVALAKGKVTMARMAMLTEDERAELLNGAGWG